MLQTVVWHCINNGHFGPALSIIDVQQPKCVRVACFQCTLFPFLLQMVTRDLCVLWSELGSVASGNKRSSYGTFSKRLVLSQCILLCVLLERSIHIM